MDFKFDVNLKAENPPAGMTPELWQQYFEVMRFRTKQSERNTMAMNLMEKKRKEKKKTTEVDLGYVDFNGETQTTLSDYSFFINNVLRTIRSFYHGEGLHDFVYYVYQITDLLRFEHDRLRTKYLPHAGCFEVWLDFTVPLKEGMRKPHVVYSSLG